MKSDVKVLGMVLSIVMASGCMMGCDRKGPSTAYDPQVDGVLPSVSGTPDLSILDNQKSAYDKMQAAAPKPAAATTPATTPAATTPAALPT